MYFIHFVDHLVCMLCVWIFVKLTVCGKFVPKFTEMCVQRQSNTENNVACNNYVHVYRVLLNFLKIL